MKISVGRGNSVPFNFFNHIKVTPFVTRVDTTFDTLKFVIPTESPNKPTNNDWGKVEHHKECLSKKENNVFHK